ncbi:MAG: ABC transporter ATP-binding protein [Candidatus Dormibacteraeota bacterium]|uniref:ABC transporter ATP-binding protein n=1 Tax=Candidatus Dormiibacter inghamiae TaxID=3127013 RepID=A0A934NCT4_9BACT|nr:ABC transporter ATP-binding protein [Candidatus Dormibacteraeota bacterium]MBJ7607562.1 ABC transporter ATP-binding protein [Candidatus Dormibacteraeota bacterium]
MRILLRQLKTLRDSAGWRFLTILPSVSPAAALVWWGLIFIRGALPAAFAVSVGLLTRAIQLQANIEVALVWMAAIFIAMNAIAPIHDALSADLGYRAGSWLHGRLIQSCVNPPGLQHLERPDLAERLERVRTFDLGVEGPPLVTAIPAIGTGFAYNLGGLVQAILLGAYAWWAPPLIAGAWIASHVLLRSSAAWKVHGSEPVVRESRRAGYVYRLAVDAPAAKELRVFGLGRWAVELVAASRRKVVDITLHEQRLRSGPVRWGLLVVAVAHALLFWRLAADAASGRIGLAALVVFAQAAFGASALASSEVDWWFRGVTEPIPSLLDLGEDMARAGSLPNGDRTASGLPASEIRFEDIRFGYAPEQPVLAGVDLVIPAGTSLAIVGANGAGKTTIAKLLCRLYDPTGGAILVDGIDIRQFDIQSWRARIAAIFQDFIRYDMSLRDNVAPLGAPDDEVERALEAAGTGDLATLDTVLSRLHEGGTDLSGGQWQRVALARALCAVQIGAGVVLLDEPTAQLDVRGESEIFNRVLEATRECTTILISHRFSTVRRADRICVLENGRVAELGTHDELMAQRGRYQRMFDLQASRFRADEAEAEFGGSAL